MGEGYFGVEGLNRCRCEFQRSFRDMEVEEVGVRELKMGFLVGGRGRRRLCRQMVIEKRRGSVL